MKSEFSVSYTLVPSSTLDKPLVNELVLEPKICGDRGLQRFMNTLKIERLTITRMDSSDSIYTR